ncbi:MAG: GNAT family N-acetyltransferase [Planctomycetes bacterium]|nr:GNAT family N-acetyltransferase [Planctomycetota bacterium]
MADGQTGLLSGAAAVAEPATQCPPGMVFRPFRNADPPALVSVWNASQLGRGALKPLGVEELESLVLAKPYFEPDGLIVACHDERPIGFVHAGFGADEPEAGLRCDTGVIAAISVVPPWRRRGVGRELLARAEQYLLQRGAKVLYAGGMRPLNPFYLGLYGGSELPGFLESDPAARPFFEACGYREADRCLVLHRDLQQRVTIFDTRFPRLRRMFRLEADAGNANPAWWCACVMGPFDQWRLRLLLPEGETAAEAVCWEMAGFSRTWGRRAVGLIGFQVAPAHRRQGLGKLLLSELLIRLREEGVQLVEVQTMQRNQPALGLYHSLGFEQVDLGVIYRRA